VAHAGVDIAVLGPVDVRGAARPFRRAAALELVVYLGFHRDGCRAADWSLALWPELAVSPSTVHSTASDARRALGCAADGRPHLCRGSRPRLGPGVSTDVEHFATLAASGEPADLVAAMRLVRGPLFSGLRHTDWAVFDGTEAAVQSLVSRTARQAAAALAGRGRDHDAVDAVRRGLRVCPYDERLYRTLLEATARAGSRTLVQRAMAHLLTLAGEPPDRGLRDPDTLRLGAVQPETAALYRRLVGPLPASGGYPSRL
jgi:DNA-binding SARP family transcriptional activator